MERTGPISKARVMDPGWQRYFVWPWDYFPIRLPACVIEMHQAELNPQGSGCITWVMDRNLPLVARVTDGDGHILHELLPEPVNCSTPSPNTKIRRVHQLDVEELNGTLGLAFTWVFYVPIISYVPPHPLGVVKSDGLKMSGYNTLITIRDTRAPKK